MLPVRDGSSFTSLERELRRRAETARRIRAERCCPAGGRDAVPCSVERRTQAR